VHGRYNAEYGRNEFCHVLPGRWWDGLRPDEERKIIQGAISLGKVTRLDLAVDVMGSDEKVSNIYNLLRAEPKRYKAQKVTLMDGTSGSTVYVGSRASEKMVRIYDKGAERGTGQKWLRFEVELKGGAARMEAARLAKCSTYLDQYYVAVQAVHWTVDLRGVECWDEASLNVPEAERWVDEQPTKEGRREWLMRVALPALVKEGVRDVNFVSQFCSKAETMVAISITP
jgi:DNA relaxase NicK